MFYTIKKIQDIINIFKVGIIPAHTFFSSFIQEWYMEKIACSEGGPMYCLMSALVNINLKVNLEIMSKWDHKQ